MNKLEFSRRDNFSCSLDLYIKNCLDWFKEANPRFYKEIIAANGNLKGARMAHLFESNETEKLKG